MVEITYLSHLEAVAVPEDDSEALALDGYFRKKVPNSEWMVRARGGTGCYWHRFWNNQTGGIGRGLVPELKRMLKSKGIPYTVDKNGHESRGESLSPEEVLSWSKSILGGDYVMRMNQAESVAACLRRKQLICQLPTGFGKSMVIYGVVRRLFETSGRRALLIVPNKQLVSQMLSDMKDYGWADMDEHAEIMHGDVEKPTFGKRLLISTWQSLKDYPVDLFDRYSCVIVDETHKSKAAELYKIIRRCRQADYRLGFTGTMPKDDHDRMMVQCHLGPVHAPSDYEEMKELGILSECEVVMVRLDYMPAERRKWCRRGYQDEIKFIEENPARHEAILGIIRDLPKEDNTLVMFSHTQHLNRMLEYFKNSGIDNIRVIVGDTHVKSREKVRSLAENEEGVVIFATYGCVQEGVNIKRLHNVVMAASSKSEIRVLQTIGRGLRIHESKDKVVIWDMVDDLSDGRRRNHTIRHAADRYDYYREQGYVVRHHRIPMLQAAADL